jgi:hypothetical protein
VFSSSGEGGQLDRGVDVMSVDGQEVLVAFSSVLGVRALDGFFLRSDSGTFCSSSQQISNILRLDLSLNSDFSCSPSERPICREAYFAEHMEVLSCCPS